MLQFIILILLILCIILCIKTLLYSRKEEIVDKISFKETMDLTNLPIVTFTCKGQKLNFLLDSGSMHCHLLTYVAEKLDILKDSRKLSTEINCQKVLGKETILPIEYNTRSYSMKVIVSHASKTIIDQLKEISGITIHGILGSDFLSMYSYILDYEKYVVYAKKKYKDGDNPFI